MLTARKDDRVKVVSLERARARLMVRAVPAPARPVHDEAMHRRGHRFHQDDRGDDDGKGDQPARGPCAAGYASAAAPSMILAPLPALAGIRSTHGRLASLLERRRVGCDNRVRFFQFFRRHTVVISIWPAPKCCVVRLRDREASGGLDPHSRSSCRTNNVRRARPDCAKCEMAVVAFVERFDEDKACIPVGGLDIGVPHAGTARDVDGSASEVKAVACPADEIIALSCPGCARDATPSGTDGSCGIQGEGRRLARSHARAGPGRCGGDNDDH